MEKLSSPTGIFPIAIPFKRYHELEGAVAEYNIEYRVDDSSIDDLIDFVSLPFIKRVNIHFDSKIPIKIVQTVNKIKDCLYVRLSADQWFSIQELRDNDIRFFMDESCPVSNFCQLDEFINMGVSDVFIADDLTYNLSDVQRYCHKHDVKLRVIINRIPMTTFDKGKSYKSPMYRPQDTKLLMQYYDVFEFDCGEPYDWNVFNVVFKAFFINQYWNGPLGELNPDIKVVFQNQAFIPYYTDFKLNCERRCSKNRPCNKCILFAEIAKSFVEKDIMFKNGQ